MRRESIQNVSARDENFDEKKVTADDNAIKQMRIIGPVIPIPWNIML